METGVKTERIDSVYLHIPFCEQFCSYCHFSKVRSTDFDMDRYVEALIREIDCNLPVDDEPLQTVYVGGGTPSILSGSQLQCLVEALIRKRRLTERTEFTLEANPRHVDEETLARWRSLGVNRLSIGVQSFLDEDLAALGRDHDARRAEKAVREAAGAGYQHLSVDILAAVKGQSWSRLQDSLSLAVSLPIDHLSLYILEKPGLAEADDEKVAVLYERSCRFVGQSGFKQYEISNFARSGGQSRHNRLYWRNGTYYGFGAVASGYDGVCEYRNEASIGKYMQKSMAGLPLVARKEYPDAQKRRLVTGLRLRAGLPETAFGTMRATSGQMKADGFLESRLGRIRIAERHILHTNSILAELI